MAYKNGSEPIMEIKYYAGDGDDSPKPGQGWWTKDGKKIPKSDFKVPHHNDIKGKMKLGNDGRPLRIEWIQFTIDDEPVSGREEPPEGSEANDVEINNPPGPI